MKKDITDRFFEFHNANPLVYALFQQYAIQAIDSGAKKIGAKAIYERLRWNLYFETKGDLKYKLNNDYVSRYARLFIHDFPEYSHKIETRTLKS